MSKKLAKEQVNLPEISVATTDVAGIVKIGEGLSVDETGTLTANIQELPIATTDVAGIVKAGESLTINETGLLNVNNTSVIQVLEDYNFRTSIIGIQDDGTRSSNGAGLKQVKMNSLNTLEAVTLSTGFFDQHLSYQFLEWTDVSSNVFMKIPIAYWWRGMLPDVIDGTTPRWTMLLSTKPGNVVINGISCEFKASDATFKKNGSYKDSFYIGKYRGHNAGDNKVGSKAGQTAWANVSFNNFKTYCSNNGADYHMLSLFEWHEILARMVIEKCTFQLMPKAVRATQANCIYRGINDFVFGPTTGVYAEWMDGIRIDASGNFEMWSTADGNYISTNKNCIIYTGESTYYCQSLYSEMDNLFISATNGAVSTSFIPDLAGMRASSNVSKVCDVNFSSSSVRSGAFDAYFYYSSADASTAIGCRLAK